MAESDAPLPKLKKRTLSSKQKQQHNFALGASGEHRACEFLEQKHFRIVETNFCADQHEVDIIAIDQSVNELVFIEVKTRTQDFSGDPSSAVNRAKLRSMKTAAAIYRRTAHSDLDYRFDIVAVLPHSLEHFENVTW